MDPDFSVSPVNSKTTEPATRNVNVSPGNGVSFSTVFEAQEASLDGVSKDKAQREAALEQLQTMVVSHFMDEIFKHQSGDIFGEGTQGDFYASTFSDAIAERLAERDIFGFAKMFDTER